jgi:hypothetical protein
VLFSALYGPKWVAVRVITEPRDGVLTRFASNYATADLRIVISASFYPTATASTHTMPIIKSIDLELLYTRMQFELDRPASSRAISVFVRRRL